MAVFDIDMTLLNNEQRYKDAKRAGIIDKDSKPKRKTRFETPGKAFKRAQEFLFDSARLDKDRLIPGAADFVNSLVEQGYIIAYCTARRLTFYEVTKRQLEKKGFPMMMDDMGRELLFMKSGGSDTSAKYKQKVITQLNSSYDVRFFFDDLVENLQAVAQVGVPGLYPSIKAYTDLSAKSNPYREASEDDFFPGSTEVAPTYMTAQTIPITALQNPPVKPRRKKMKNGKYRKEPAKKYIDRFMGNSKMVSEFPDRGQRYAVSLRYVEKFYGKRGLDSVGARQNPGHPYQMLSMSLTPISEKPPNTRYPNSSTTGIERTAEKLYQETGEIHYVVVHEDRPDSYTNYEITTDPSSVVGAQYIFMVVGDIEEIESLHGFDTDARQNPAPNCGCGQSPCVTYGTRSNPEEYSENYMVPRDIHRLGKAADRLEDTYEDGQEVPEWWKSKMSVAAKDADTLADALEYVDERGNPGHSRDSLPFRPTSDCFLTYKGKLVAKDMGHYIAFPGGGVDPGESPKAAAKREVMEEVGAVLKGDLKPMGDVSWVWNPEWADSPKRKKRYQQFQGEQVYFFTGEVEKFVKPTSDEGDAWSGKKLMKFSDAIAYLQAEKANLKYPNQAKYIDYQIACLSQIQKAKGKMTGAQYRAGVKKMLEARVNPMPLMGLSVQVSGYRNAAGAFVMKGKKFLILQRSTKETSMHGLWELPGGKVEEGETPRQTAVIEVKEEAGLDITLKSNLGPHHDDKKKKTYHAYIATPKKGQKVKLSEEHSAHKWVTPEEVLAMPKKMVSHHLLYFLKKEGETIRSNPRKNPGHEKKIEKGKKLYKHMNGKEPEKITKQKIDVGDVWYQVGEGGCWQIGYMSGKETGSSSQKYTHTFNEETQDGNFPKLYATMPENGKPLLIIQGGTWKIKTDDKGVAWIYD